MVVGLIDEYGIYIPVLDMCIFNIRNTSESDNRYLILLFFKSMRFVY